MTQQTQKLLLQEYIDYLSFVQTNSIDKSASVDYVTHLHHKIPRCLGGNDQKQNIVRLQVENHVRAHLLLAKCFDEDSYECVQNLRSANLIDKKQIRDESEMEKFRDSYRGEKNPFFGKTHSKEQTDKAFETKKRNGSTKRGERYEQMYSSPEEEKKKRANGVKSDWANMSDEERSQRKANIGIGLSKMGKEKLQERARNAAIKGKGFIWVIDGKEFVTQQEAQIFFNKRFPKIVKEHEVSKKCV